MQCKNSVCVCVKNVYFESIKARLIPICIPLINSSTCRVHLSTTIFDHIKIWRTMPSQIYAKNVYFHGMDFSQNLNVYAHTHIYNKCSLFCCGLFIRVSCYLCIYIDIYFGSKRFALPELYVDTLQISK